MTSSNPVAPEAPLLNLLLIIQLHAGPFCHHHTCNNTRFYINSRGFMPCSSLCIPPFLLYNLSFHFLSSLSLYNRLNSHRSPCCTSIHLTAFTATHQSCHHPTPWHLKHPLRQPRSKRKDWNPLTKNWKPSGNQSQKCTLPSSSSLNKVETKSWFMIKENITPNHTTHLKMICELLSTDYSLPMTTKKQVKMRECIMFFKTRSLKKHSRDGFAIPSGCITRWYTWCKIAAKSQ